mmetsp:Transcript_34386/g.31095  ORF Transcript_34386/g.31095 Transcript_34386/m.31095 type:complete len:162 (-) Transcript_34386:189-674(-)|eukprot:CAMPEP_0114595478 /NCGR_PEP_ID=MMETSP0125-20121206/17276_1 /TAXON_ID=485358 ORGANISM="Aristerostoma sp., Strain ATCC 50986" /NCGR_SAMPLE_ID=MMETSP0125 /ASSEMBLY_ACC=CAM_ASM_000245 /LENGTH=161 /DNA_ID=CAMNT_0001797105 /DNA_START=152 /DNA_END=637 /DNA_ORIENTATION=+
MAYDDVEELCLDFTYETEVMGQRVIKELIPGGADIKVTNENKKQYVSQFCFAMTTKDVEKQLTAFLKGFRTVLPKGFIEHLNPADLDQIIRGTPEIDLKQFKTNFSYVGCQESDELVKWFWDILETFTQEELSTFLFFISGSSRLPYGGLKRKIEFMKINL